jgi:hypothetical protein
MSTAIDHPLESHAHSADFWTDFMSIATDPAHLAFEFVFSIVFDFIIVTLLYGIVFKKFLLPKLRKSIHEEIDKEHGVEHPKDSPLP